VRDRTTAGGIDCCGQEFPSCTQRMDLVDSLFAGTGTSDLCARRESGRAQLTVVPQERPLEHRLLPLRASAYCPVRKSRGTSQVLPPGRWPTADCGGLRPFAFQDQYGWLLFLLASATIELRTFPPTAFATLPHNILRRTLSESSEYIFPDSRIPILVVVGERKS
jgi:hypothetical protein